MTTFTFNNTMFIGLPINSIVLGHDGLPYLFTFYLVTITMFWSLGAFTLLGPGYLGIVTFTVADLPLKVFVLSASLPCHAQTAILAEYYDLEGEYASNLVSLSMLICLFTIPIYASVLL